MQTASLVEVAGRILETLDSANLVCLGEVHGSPDDAALRTALIEHPDFLQTVDIIVVEFASPLHQELLDRAILDGEPLTRDQLRPLWFDAGGGEFWEAPIYEDFLRAVAKVNRPAPRDDRVRIVGGAVPIPWAEVRTAAGLAPYLDRRRWYAQTLDHEVLEPGRKGLAIYGAGHCEKSGMGIPVALRIDARAAVYSVRSLPRDRRGNSQISRWFPPTPSPSWIPIRGTALAIEPAGELFFEGHRYAETTLGEVADGLVDFGSDTEAQPSVGTPSRHGLSPEMQLELERRSRLREQAQRIDIEPPRAE
ncbi:MAG: hypothetical protein K8J08_03525 [Thermoanaerobaculia bacterium]|nr:hypothetical protein [Thermoanaerobaculia bacterium]